MKKTFVKLSVFSLITSLFFSSCASIVTQTSYPVSINTNPQGANIVVLDKKGREVYRGQSPATVTLRSSNGYMSGGRYEVQLSGPGYEAQTVSIHSKLEGWYFVNILFGGLIGMLIVDPASGAMYKLDTTPLNVTLHKKDVLSDNNDSNKVENTSFNIIDIKDVPEEMKEYLVKVN